jgi:Domain of unknown function (DUF4249)
LELEILKMKHMQNIFYSFILAVVLLMGFSSCQQDAEVDVPNVPSKLVISSFISPQDTVISIRVTASQPVFQTSNININDPIINATVMLFDEANQSIQIPFDAQYEAYRISATAFPIVSGQAYRLEVSAPSFETVKASTVIPGATPSNFTSSVTYTIDSSQIWYWTYEFIDTYSFTEISGTVDLYMVGNSIVIFDSTANDSFYIRAGNEFLTDQNQDGQVITNSSTGTFDFAASQPGYSVKPIARLTYFTRCSPEYYYFHQSLGNNNNGGDPFAEPTPMYTNIENGYGVFAGCTYVVNRINF